MDSIIEFANVVLPKVDHHNISDLKYLFQRLERPDLSHFTDSEKNFCVLQSVHPALMDEIEFGDKNTYKTTKKLLLEEFGPSYESTKCEIKMFCRKPTESIKDATKRMYRLLDRPTACYKNKFFHEKFEILANCFKRIMPPAYFERFLIFWQNGPEEDMNHTFRCIKKMELSDKFFTTHKQSDDIKELSNRLDDYEKRSLEIEDSIKITKQQIECLRNKITPMANGISEILQFQQTQAQPQINKNTLDNVTKSKKSTLSSESCHGILSLRQKDILQLVGHIQSIDKNDPKLFYQIFS